MDGQIKIQNLIPPVLQQRDEFVHDPALCNRTDDRARKGFQKEWFHDRNRFAGAAAAHDKDIVIQSGFRQSVLKMQPSPRIMRSALSGYFAGMFKDRVLRFAIALILPCF